MKIDALYVKIDVLYVTIHVFNSRGHITKSGITGWYDKSTFI